jgi:hypothetical protein
VATTSMEADATTSRTPNEYPSTGSGITSSTRAASGGLDLSARQNAIIASGIRPQAGVLTNAGLVAGRSTSTSSLLSAPLEVILERVRTRTTNPYGKTAAQQNEIRLIGHKLTNASPCSQSRLLQMD